jgi:hypothetical protein
MKREPPRPPYPDLLRSPPSSFGWLDARLLRDGWLGLLGPERIAALTLLSLAADRTGSSFYRRETMALSLSMPRAELDEALERLLELGLVAHRPWAAGHLDGVWQILQLPRRRP